MKTAMTFDRIVGLADGLPLPQKESLLEILTKRLVEQRRKALRNDVLEARRDFRTGKCVKATPAEIMREIMR